MNDYGGNAVVDGGDADAITIADAMARIEESPP